MNQKGLFIKLGLFRDYFVQYSSFSLAPIFKWHFLKMDFSYNCYSLNTFLSGSICILSLKLGMLHKI